MIAISAGQQHELKGIRKDAACRCDVVGVCEFVGVAL